MVGTTKKNYDKIEQRQFKHNIKSSKCSVDDRRERNRLRNLHLMKERIELKDLDVCREKAVKYSLRSLKSLEVLKANVRFPELLCGYGTLRS